MDPQITQALTTLFTAEGWSKYVILIPTGLAFLHVAVQSLVMPKLIVPEPNATGLYPIVYSILAKFTRNVGNNAPVPASALKAPVTK